jgi:hypothetical protein
MSEQNDNNREAFIRLLVERDASPEAAEWLALAIGSQKPSVEQEALNALFKNVEPTEEFWASPAGQYVAETQFNLYRDDLITKADAAKLLYGDASAANLMKVTRLAERGAIRRIRRPESAYKHRRAEDNRETKGEARRAWLLVRSDVERLLAAQRRGKKK